MSSRTTPVRHAPSDTPRSRARITSQQPIIIWKHSASVSQAMQRSWPFAHLAHRSCIEKIFDTWFGKTLVTLNYSSWFWWLYDNIINCTNELWAQVHRIFRSYGWSPNRCQGVQIIVKNHLRVHRPIGHQLCRLDPMPCFLCWYLCI